MQYNKDIIIIGNLLYEIQTVESNNEKQRIILSQSADFYPEIAFTVLKKFERPKPQDIKNIFSNFFDFSSTTDHIQYNFINSLKEGIIPYSNLQEFLLEFEVQSTDKQLEIIFQQLGVNTENANGITYEQFLSFISPFSFPQAKHELLRRKVIYEANGINDKLKRNHQTILAKMLKSELELLKYSEISKLKLIELNWVPLKAFEYIDFSKQGFLSFESISKLFKQCQKQFTPRDYLCLLRRMKKPENCDTISFQDFTSILLINQPFFNPQSLNSPVKMLSSQMYSTTNKVHPNLNQSQIKPTDAYLFIDQQGRIVEKPHPTIIQYVEKNPQVNQIINQNNRIVNLDSSIYPILPQSQYDAKNYDPTYHRKNSDSEEDESKNNVKDDQKDIEFKKEERKRIFQLKDAMMKNNNPYQKKQLYQSHPLFQEMYRIGQNSTVKKDLHINQLDQNQKFQFQQYQKNDSNDKSQSNNLQQTANNITRDLNQQRNVSNLYLSQYISKNYQNQFNIPILPIDQDVKQKQRLFQPIKSPKLQPQFMQKCDPQPDDPLGKK